MMLVIIIFGITLPTQIVSAADTDGEDYASIISQAPEGLSVAKYFKYGDFSLADGESSDSYPFTTNSANVYTSSTDTKHSGQVINLANSNKVGQVGAAWSNKDADNYIDINKPQTVSVWLYFGSGAGEETRNGEGMSLVLQNDKRGTSAMGAGYQSLGSLGFDNAQVTSNFGIIGWSQDPSSGTINTADQASQSAIGKSIALDFNAQDNDISGSKFQEPLKLMQTSGLLTRKNIYTLNSYTTAYSRIAPPTTYPEYDALQGRTDLGEHPLYLGNTGSSTGTISLTYPGNPVTYAQMPIALIRNDNKLTPSMTSSSEWSYLKSAKYALSTFQVGSQPADLINGHDENNNEIFWHHLTFTWTPATANSPATIKYVYNDKYPDGTVNNDKERDYQKLEETIPVDASAFGNPSDGRVYWGLTGANSSESDVYGKLAVFESIPALATATATAQIKDADSGQVINDSTDSQNNLINNGDKLDFNYKLAWDSNSRKDWTQINSDIKLPPDVKYTTAEITYHNANGEANPITISDANGLSNNELKYAIASLGNITDSNGYTSADIDVTGYANNTTGAIVTEDTQPANFDGTNAIESTSSPLFRINNNKVIQKYLQLNVSKNLEFQDVNYKATTKYLPRKTPFKLSVTDLKEPWTLKVSTTDLKDGTQPFYGNLVYKQNADATPLNLDDSLQEIDSGKASDTASTTLISSDWTKNSGLLLEPNATETTPAGTYTGTMTWEVDDTE